MEISLMQILEAREKRVQMQDRLLRDYGLPLLSFTMNIPGPIKTSPLIQRGFLAGCRALDCRLPKAWVRYREINRADTGWEAFYVLDAPALEVKKITAAIEDHHGLGRLFDMDVLDTDHRKLDRSLVGGKSRDCIVCGAPGRDCAASRAHTVPQLQEAVRSILLSWCRREDARRIGAWAVQSLTDEVCTTPKPGLVDCLGSGSHRDMDLFTFSASAAALSPYFTRCAELGIETRKQEPGETFALLRQEGLRAEEQMYEATGGVNTHKGAIFTMGVLCGAAGRLWDPVELPKPEQFFPEVAAMTSRAMEEDFRRLGTDTPGGRLYHARGLRGIRGQAAAGLPAIRDIGLPVYRACTEKGMGKNEAGVTVLLHLIAQVEDTNMAARGGPSGAAEGAALARRYLEKAPDEAALSELCRVFQAHNWSPGGCADLLAGVYFLSHFEV